MSVIQFPSTSDNPNGLTNAELLAENAQLRMALEDRDRRIHQQTITIDRLRAQLSERQMGKAIRSLPNTVAGPSTKLAVEALRETKKQWEAQGKSGPQPFALNVLGEQMGMDRRAAGPALKEAEKLGLVKTHEVTVGHGHAKRTHLTVELTEKLDEDPATWERPEPRNPNGKGCECNADTVATVAVRKVAVERVAVMTRCKKCGAVHSYQRIHRPKTHKITGEIERLTHFDTLEHGLAYAKDRRSRKGELDESYWSSKLAGDLENDPDNEEFTAADSVTGNATSDENTLIGISNMGEISDGFDFEGFDA